MNEKRKKEARRLTAWQAGWLDARRYFRRNWQVLLLFLATFVASGLCAFARIAAGFTISSYNISDYHVGQVAFETIVAPKSLPPTAGNPVAVLEGETVTERGFAITEEQFAKLLKMSESPDYIDFRALLKSLLYLFLLALVFYFLTGRTCIGYDMPFKDAATECVLFLLTYGAASFGMKVLAFSSPFVLAVIIPASFCTFLVAILYGHRNALFFSVVSALGVFNACGYAEVPFLFVLGSSLVASRIVLRIGRRNDLVSASLLQALWNVLLMLTLRAIFGAPLHDAMFPLIGVAFNGFLSGILCLGFLTPIELLLNTASLFRLMDLSDLNAPTMKTMLQTASGTYNHSLMVASLAEAACREIGANALLARVASYYHDIGKLDNPEYFTENQRDKDSNIHNSINPSLSVSVIKSHVKKGVEKARELHLPAQVIQIIAEHHGNQVIEYFYREAKKINPDADPVDYSYTGTPPSTRESAVVMLADTVEAAFHSLDKNPSYSFLSERIKALMDHKVELNQMSNCGLTFKDMRLIHDVFLQILAGHYHSRVKYPGQTEEGAQPPAAEPAPKEAAVREAEQAGKDVPSSAPAEPRKEEHAPAQKDDAAPAPAKPPVLLEPSSAKKDASVLREPVSAAAPAKAPAKAGTAKAAPAAKASVKTSPAGKPGRSRAAATEAKAGKTKAARKPAAKKTRGGASDAQ